VTYGSLTIQVADAQVTLDAPVRPGIFEAEIVPGTPGEHEIIYSLQSGETTDLVHAHARVAVEHGHGDHAHEGEALHGHEEETAHEHTGEVPHDHEGEARAEAGGHAHPSGTPAEGEITFLKEQAWKSDFMVREVSPAPFSAVVKASGQVLAVPGEKRHLAAHSSGMLVFRDKLLVQGSRVKKGQPLFVIMATSLTDDNFEVRYRELRNNLEQSRSEYRRHEKLFREQVISERQFIASRTRYENDSIRFRSMASKASADGLQITAPVSGTIHELNFSEGQYVETGDQLVTISSNEQLLLRADVPMQHYPLVGRIVTANFRTGYSDRIYNVEELKGSLLARGSSVAENDHFIPVYFEVTNDGTLLEGAFAEFFLKSGEQEQVIVVPAGAISEEQGIHYCYLQVTGESYTKKEVTVGESDGRYYEISSGLKKGDRVVTEGVMLLKAASMVTGDAGHGHAH
jgi:RND family efflux transporter MFP subunit